MPKRRPTRTRARVAREDPFDQLATAQALQAHVGQQGSNQWALRQAESLPRTIKGACGGVEQPGGEAGDTPPGCRSRLLLPRPPRRRARMAMPRRSWGRPEGQRTPAQGEDSGRSGAPAAPAPKASAIVSCGGSVPASSGSPTPTRARCTLGARALCSSSKAPRPSAPTSTLHGADCAGGGAERALSGRRRQGWRLGMGAMVTLHHKARNPAAGRGTHRRAL